MDGIYTKDRISINFSENEKKFSNEAVQIAKDGGKSNIKIMEASGAAFVLKEIGSATESGIQGNLYPADDTRESISGQIMAVLPENVSDTANHITEEDSEELEENGMTIERYNSERLERLLAARKAMAELKEKALEGVKEDAENSRETAEKVGKKNAIRKELDPRKAVIAERLLEANLPATDDNISRIAEAMKLAGEAQSMTEASFSYLIDHKLQPTIENCYVAAHSGVGGRHIVSDSAFAELRGSIENVAAGAGLEADAELFENARMLLTSGAPVTAENLQYTAELKELKASLSDNSKAQLVQKAVLDGSIESLKNYREPKSTNLYTVIKREEIRLEMTAATTSRMKELGIEQDLEALKSRIEKLLQAEKDASKSVLKGLENADQAADIFEKTLQSVESVAAAGESLLAATFTNRVSITLTQLSTAVSVTTSISGRQLQASISYEAAATEVRRDLGDSISKAFAGIDETLQDMKLEATEANRKAVRMLGYSSTEITKENISEMKYYASEVQSLVDNLKPQTTAELIKRGINPLETTVRELSELAQRINGELGQTTEERYSEYLVKLEKNREITAEQRESYIGIYRMLYQIEKTDGAAVSALVKSGRELTLKNLLTESRTRRNGKLDTKVDDEFGAAESVSREELTIDQQIRVGFERSVLTRIERKASPERLYALDESTKAEGKDFTELPTEIVAEALEQMPEGVQDAAFRSERLEAFRETITQSATEEGLLKAFALENTAASLEAAKQYMNDGSAYGRLKKLGESKLTEKAAKETDLSLDEIPETEPELSEKLENIRANVKELMTSLYLNADLSGKEANDLSSMGRLIELTGALARKKSYDIPITDGEEITNIHLTLIHSREAQGGFLVTLPEGLRAEGSLTGGKLSVLLSAEDRRQADGLKAEREVLKERLAAVGFEDADVFVEQSSGRSRYLTPADGTAETENLYKAARELVVYLRHIYKEA